MIRQQRWTAHSSFDSMSVIMRTKEHHGPLPFSFGCHRGPGGLSRVACRFSSMLLRTGHRSIVLPFGLIWSLGFCDCFTSARHSGANKFKAVLVPFDAPSAVTKSIFFVISLLGRGTFTVTHSSPLYQ